MSQAVALIEDNQALTPPAMRARGAAAGHFRDADGKRRHFNLDAKLLVRPADYMRFVMEHALSGDEVRVGMNETMWWVWVARPEEQELEGRRGEGGVLIGGTVPVRAQQLMEALGLAPLSPETAAQRITDEHQQLIYVIPGDGRRVIEKEFWIDRYSPWLLRRVLYRDTEGRIVLSSELDNYRPIEGTGALLPHRLRMTWPGEDAEMRLRIKRWWPDESLTPDHPAFMAPSDRREWLKSRSSR
jgi:hypothetical protein